MEDKNLKKLQKLAHLKSDSEVILLETIEETQTDILKEVKNTEDRIMSEISTIKTAIDSIEIPEQKDHTEHMQKMMEMIQEPEEIIVKLNIV